MGYTITIGNAEMDIQKDGEYLIMVNVLTDKNALDYPSSGWDKTSSHGPAYSVLSKFVKDTKLKKLFGKTATGNDIISDGVFSLSGEDLDLIKNRKKQYQEKHPNAVPQFNASGPDAFLARLYLYEYWVDYAIKNCKNPAIEISG